MPVTETVFELLSPVVRQLGLELIDVEWHGNTLRVVVDADGGVTTDQLASANRMISPLLDQHDPIPGRYTLEVSSPGVERPLNRVDHYRRAVGEDVVVKTIRGHEPRRIKGRLVSADDERIEIDTVEVDGIDLADSERRVVALTDIEKARTVFDWGPTPKPTAKKGQGNKRKPGQSRSNKKPGNTSGQSKSRQHEKERESS